MNPIAASFLLVISMTFGIIGSLIGRPKGFPVWGFFMGALLWLIGIVIVTLWKPSKNSACS